MRFLALLLAAGMLAGCRREPAPGSGQRGRRPPLIVVGIDGGEWKVIHRLWGAGKLPNLKRISEQGVATTLRTAYNSSPVIWTTIATGVTPEVHGITDFVVPTPRGDVPLSSAVRKVPALWNMLSRAGRRVAVLGWWASWPAEKVGFHASHREDVKALVAMDALLERLGYLTRGKNGIDFARTRVYTYGSSGFERFKMLRFSLAGREPGGTVRPEERAALHRRLEADLATVTNDRGEPVLFLREAHPKRGDDGDFVAVVRLQLVTPVLRVQGSPFPPALRSLGRISGTHTPSTHGIFLAMGPDIDPRADLTGIHVHDMTPTILYALGLPVGEDFAGRARTALFKEEFRRAYPPRTIKTWGARQGAGGAKASKADEDLLNELRSLGYIR